MGVKIVDRLTGADKLTGDSLKAILESAATGKAKIEKGQFPVEEVKGASLAGLHVDDSDMSQAVMTNCVLDDAEITQTSMQAAKLSGVSAKRAKLQVDAAGAVLTNLDATDATIEDSRFRGAYLSGVFKNAKISKCAFTATDMRDANFDGASFDENCTFERCLFVPTQLDKTALCWNQHDIAGAFLYVAAQAIGNVEYQQAALLIRERDDLCKEFYEEKNTLYSESFRTWALDLIGQHIENNAADTIDKHFLRAIIAVRPSEVLEARL